MLALALAELHEHFTDYTMHLERNVPCPPPLLNFRIETSPPPMLTRNLQSDIYCTLCCEPYFQNVVAL
jgi:hypothetical protein